ncbi:monovalent cation:proton antiporter family protein [Methylococcus sp. EFPC2]|uniref:monovalent cation:proton antiporter family protein n=1 Tax=Methylococcus sp. EFPC2 TaxID=2812648 RepID=UPI001967C200|nr:monovalent cation:proton antiporter family protein [Methylococcus sp. EFPC2]QSA97112.1 cation:proton antiporter [Methylococcus sp. EFPC2]
MNSSLFDDLLLIFGASVLISALFGRLRLAPILGYLLVGVAFGPGALGLLNNVADIHDFAEFGIVFLLFSLGLEFSIPKMLALRRTVFGLGGLQVAVCQSVIVALAWFAGVPFVGALVIGGALALSSTAIVSKELLRSKEFNRHHGQLAFGVLLFQDLAALLFILMAPVLHDASLGDGPRLVGELLLRGILLFSALLALGHWVLPKLFELVAKAGGEELLVLAALVVALFAGWVTHLFELPMSLGAFVAGVTLGESHYRHQIEADIRPFRDVLLGLFFVGVGALLEFSVVVEFGPWLVLAALVLLTVKAGLLAGLALAMRENARNALRVGFMLAQGGEFGFVLLNLGGQQHLLDTTQVSFVSGVIILSMLATPVATSIGRRFAEILRKRDAASAPPDEASIASLEAQVAELDRPVLICGYGRVGQTVSRFLRRFGIPFVALDSDPMRVREAAEAGESVFIGDSRRPELLKAAGIEQARLVVISFSEEARRSRTLATVRTVRTDVPVLVRTSDDTYLQDYLDQGASEVVPESLEGALMLVSHVLAMLNVPIGQIVRAINQVRRERYQILQGYFQGEQTRLIDEEGRRLKVLHAIPLPENASAAGSRIVDLGLDEFGVTLSAVRRGHSSIQSPPPEYELMAGDIVILLGETEQIDQAESRLLAG